MSIHRKWAVGLLRAVFCAGMAMSSANAAGASASACGERLLILLGENPDARIEAKYQEMGGPAGLLGAPFHAARKSTDGEGWYRTYEHGVIYWNPTTGAHEVHGAIAKLWSAVGREKGYLGYPISDEVGLANGSGRVGRFQYGYIEWQPGSGQVSVDYLEPLPVAVTR